MNARIANLRWRMPALTVTQFFHPLMSNRLLVVSACVVFTIFFLVLDTQIDRVSGENGIGAMILANEAKFEVGPDVRVAGKQHFELAQMYLRSSEQRGVATLAKYADSTFDRNQQIGPATASLAISFFDDSKSNDQLLETIHNFAGELREYGRQSYQRASCVDRRFGWRAKTPILTPKDRSEIELAIRDFSEAGEALKASPSFEVAQNACLKSRAAAAKLYLRWNDYKLAVDRHRNIERFEKTLDLCIDLFPKVQGSEFELKLLHSYSHSLQRRRALLDLFRKENFSEIYHFLEDSYAENRINLAAN